MFEPKQGIYRHRSGQRIELLDIVRHYETGEAMVVYRELYGDCNSWVCPLSMWTEIAVDDTIDIQQAVIRPQNMDLTENNDDITPVSEDFSSEISTVDLPPKLKILKRYYGYDGFRDGQEVVVDSILSGQDTLAVMPTGAGKSICYQVPALVMDGVALVISPLISLMKDQVQTLIQSGIPAAYLNSSLTDRQFDLAMRNAARGQYRIIYVAPERLLTPRFQSIAMGMKISMIAVDEAHCISQWGQDFRPSYLTIPEFLDSLPHRPVVCAFTATATERVRHDIQSLLQLNDPFIQITGFDRKNLYYAVSKPSKKDSELLKLLKTYSGMSGIVYCATRKKVESVYELLLEHGISVTRYHAGLSDAERQNNQDDFAYDRREVMVATNAFGMGIDKSNVRFVVHYNMPKDIESYYQEAGRAGRDGERADCHLLFSRQDILTQQYFIDHMGEEAGLEGAALEKVQVNARKRLDSMIRYCQSTKCLRRYILEYFGESAPGSCDFCLNCLNPPEQEDVTELAKAALRCIDQTGERFGRGMIIDVLRGAESDRIQQFRLDNLLSYGALRHIPRDQVSSIIDKLQEMDAIQTEIVNMKSGQYPILRLNETADKILAGNLTVSIVARTKKEKKDIENMSMNVDRDLFARLTALRKKIAFSRGIPPYVIFHDSVLRNLSDKKPTTMQEMELIGGIGVVKLREFGKAFLKEIQKYVAESEGNKK